MDGSLLQIGLPSYMRMSISYAGNRAKEAAAKEMQMVTNLYAERKGIEPPKYEFLELIGKGSFGRVFKSASLETGELVAIKVVEIDAADYSAHPEDKDATIRDTLREISVLIRLKESGTENINVIIEAFEYNTQFWIVTEYCPGGSVYTLMKASPSPGLEETFIIPIARELALALKSVHAAGIVHRDIKCSNIFITEEGGLQLGDFGIAGILDTNFSKRSTLLGTPNWMPPEMVDKMFGSKRAGGIHYGYEVDCWSYGCVIYEMATGSPPYSRVHPLDLRMHLRNNPLRLEGERFSPELQNFVTFCLRDDPKERPTAAEIYQHPYLANTSESHPVQSLQILIGRFIMWEQAGGQRASLFTPVGAKRPEIVSGYNSEIEDEWNFSMTEEFSRRMSLVPSANGTLLVDGTSKPDGLNPRERRLKEAQIRRGGQLQLLFNPIGAPYKLRRRASSQIQLDGSRDSDNASPGDDDDTSTATGTTTKTTSASIITGDSNSRSTHAAIVEDETIDLDGAQIDHHSHRHHHKQIDSRSSNVETGLTIDVKSSKRATMEWKFPDSAKKKSVSRGKARVTMEWNFETAMSELQLNERSGGTSRPLLHNSTNNQSDDDGGENNVNGSSRKWSSYQDRSSSRDGSVDGDGTRLHDRGTGNSFENLPGVDMSRTGKALTQSMRVVTGRVSLGGSALSGPVRRLASAESNKRDTLAFKFPMIDGQDASGVSASTNTNESTSTSMSDSEGGPRMGGESQYMTDERQNRLSPPSWSPRNSLIDLDMALPAARPTTSAPTSISTMWEIERKDFGMPMTTVPRQTSVAASTPTSALNQHHQNHYQHQDDLQSLTSRNNGSTSMLTSEGIGSTGTSQHPSGNGVGQIHQQSQPQPPPAQLTSGAPNPAQSSPFPQPPPPPAPRLRMRLPRPDPPFVLDTPPPPPSQHQQQQQPSVRTTTSPFMTTPSSSSSSLSSSSVSTSNSSSDEGLSARAYNNTGYTPTHDILAAEFARLTCSFADHLAVAACGFDLIEDITSDWHTG